MIWNDHHFSFTRISFSFSFSIRNSARVQIISHLGLRMYIIPIILLFPCLVLSRVHKGPKSKGSSNFLGLMMLYGASDPPDKSVSCLGSSGSSGNTRSVMMKRKGQTATQLSQLKGDFPCNATYWSFREAAGEEKKKYEWQVMSTFAVNTEIKTNHSCLISGINILLGKLNKEDVWKDFGLNANVTDSDKGAGNFNGTLIERRRPLRHGSGGWPKMKKPESEVKPKDDLQKCYGDSWMILDRDWVMESGARTVWGPILTICNLWAGQILLLKATLWTCTGNHQAHHLLSSQTYIVPLLRIEASLFSVISYLKFNQLPQLPAN